MPQHSAQFDKHEIDLIQPGLTTKLINEYS